VPKERQPKSRKSLKHRIKKKKKKRMITQRRRKKMTRKN
jgi:hypothetical protein